MLRSLVEPPARPARASPRLVRTVELVRADRLGHVDGDAADVVDQLAEVGEVDEHDVIDRQAGDGSNGADGERCAAKLVGGVDLLGPVARNLDAQVAQDREVVEAMVLRIRADHDHRVGMAKPAARIRLRVVGSHDEDVRRLREQEAVLLHRAAYSGGTWSNVGAGRKKGFDVARRDG